MIELTRLNGNPLAVNCDLLKYVESSPDTTLTLVTGEKIVVRESCATVIARVLAYRALLLSETGVAEQGRASTQAAARSASTARAIAPGMKRDEDLAR